MRFLPFLFIFISCTEADNLGDNDIQIKYGTECGWCAGEEFIIINQSDITYKRIIPCGDMAGTYSSKRPITKEEWNGLQKSMDYKKFKTLDYNSCNVCSDGCDEILRLSDRVSDHEIRYSPSDNIKGFEEVIDILRDMIEEF